MSRYRAAAFAVCCLAVAAEATAVGVRSEAGLIAAQDTEHMRCELCMTAVQQVQYGQLPACGGAEKASGYSSVRAPARWPERPGQRFAAPMAQRDPRRPTLTRNHPRMDRAQCSQVVQSMLAYAADVMHLLAYGCYKYSPYHGWQTVKPCPAHVLCGRLPNIFDEERAVRGRGPWGACAPR